MGGRISKARRASAHGCSVVASGLGSSKLRRRRSSDTDTRSCRVSASDDEARQECAHAPATAEGASGTPERIRHNGLDPEDCPTGRSQSTGVPSTPEAFSGTSASSNSSPSTVTHEAAATPPSPQLAHAIAVEHPFAEAPHQRGFTQDNATDNSFSSGQSMGGGTAILSATSVRHQPVGVSIPRVAASSMQEGVGATIGGPGSWLASRLDQEMTANDEAIARALSEQLTREAASPRSPNRRRASEPALQRERNQIVARDEALAIALALAEEETTEVAQLHRQRVRTVLSGAGLRMPTPQVLFPLQIDEHDASPGSARDNRGEGEKCIACEDNVVNCCLIPCGHVILCIPCARRVIPRRCPVCRLQFEQVVRTSRRTRNV